MNPYSSGGWRRSQGTETIRKLALKLVATGLLLFGHSTVAAMELVCFLVSSIELEAMGQKIKHEITDTDDLNIPESYFYFDLENGKTAYFWTDSDGNKTREEEPIEHASGPLYYGKYESTDGDVYSSYFFESDFSGGLIIEAGNVYAIHCEKMGLEEAEKKHGLAFSEYRLP